jgi:hypothetical protein
MLKKFNYFLEFLSKYISMVISGSFFSDFPPEDWLVTSGYLSGRKIDRLPQLVKPIK